MEAMRGVFETPISRAREATASAQEGVSTANESRYQVQWLEP